MFRRVLPYIALAVVVLTSRGEPIAPNQSEPDYKPKNLGELQCYRTVTLRGVLTFEHHRKLEPPPEVTYSTYVLRTPGVYTVKYKIDARQTYFHTGVGDFHVEAPHQLSLIPYRGQHVEISGRVIPEGKFHQPTLVVDKISRLHEQKHLTKRWSEPLTGATIYFR